MYEYKFVEIPIKRGLKDKKGDTFNECKKVIEQEAKNGWRLKQIVMPLDFENPQRDRLYCHRYLVCGR